MTFVIGGKGGCMKIQKVIINGIECILCEDPRIIIKSGKYKYKYTIIHKGTKATIVPYNSEIFNWYGNVFSTKPLLSQNKSISVKNFKVDPYQKVF